MMVFYTSPTMVLAMLGGAHPDGWPPSRPRVPLATLHANPAHSALRRARILDEAAGRLRVWIGTAWDRYADRVELAECVADERCDALAAGHRRNLRSVR